MLFSSYTFVFGFLPVTLVGWLLLTRWSSTRAGLAWLVAASLFFYGWFEPAYLVLIGISILGNHLLARAILAGGGTVEAAGRRWLTIGVVANLGALAYFKYAQFTLDTVNALAGTTWSAGDIVLPLAISFFTFQQIAYLADVATERRGLYPLGPYTLFVVFFPQLIAGPIVHHKELLPQLQSPGTRDIGRDLAVGLSIFIVGLAKKSLIADSLAPAADGVFMAADAGAIPSSYDAWVGICSYTFQIYFDFSGYSDMAIGLARMFGVRLPINFNSPYKSADIQEFWRRWHITLSRFLRDYLYIPLGGNRHGEARRLMNLAATMLLGGLWHGAGWNFVIWGGLHGLYLVVHRGVSGPGRRKQPRSWAHRGVAQAITLAAVVFAWVFFRAATFSGATTMLGAACGLLRPGLPTDLSSVWAVAWVGVAAVIALTMPNTQQLFHHVDPGLDAAQHGGAPAPHLAWMAWRPTPAWGVTLAVLGVCSIIGLSRSSAFIYFQF